MSTPNAPLGHLATQPTAKEMANYKLRRMIGSIFHAAPFLRRPLAFAKSTLVHIENIDAANRETAEYSKKKGTMLANSYDSGFGYKSPAHELEVAEYYRKQIASNAGNYKSESGTVYKTVIDLSEEVFKDSATTKMLNFGVSYAYTDSLLAEKYPHISFAGVDRSEITKVYNEQYFNLPNLSFVADDIFECMEAGWDNALFAHIRTHACLPREFVEKIYSTAFKAGFKYILGVESCGISWQTGKHYPFSLADQDSVSFRNGMYIHNYPFLLEKHGYSLMHSQILKTPHPDPNFRLISFVAKATAS